MAESLGADRRFPREKRPVATQILLPYRVSVPLGAGPARGKSPPEHSAESSRAKAPHEGYNVFIRSAGTLSALPTENYAIKTGIHPAIVTRDNVDVSAAA